MYPKRYVSDSRLLSVGSQNDLAPSWQLTENSFFLTSGLAQPSNIRVVLKTHSEGAHIQERGLPESLSIPCVSFNGIEFKVSSALLAIQSKSNDETYYIGAVLYPVRNKPT